MQNNNASDQVDENLHDSFKEKNGNKNDEQKSM